MLASRDRLGTSRRRRVVLTAFAIMAGAAGVALLAGFVLFVGALQRAEVLPRRHADGIVVLTGGADRIGDALGLLLGHQGDRLLISGVNPSTSAGDITRDFPEVTPLRACCIELDYAAANTIGNARETRAWVRRHNIRTLMVVTSNYHMPRALAEIGDAAPEVELVPFAVVSERPGEASPWPRASRLRLEAVEYVKYLVVLARTRLFPQAPY